MNNYNIFIKSFFLSFILFFTVVSAASIYTDKNEYNFEETVIIDGTEFPPNLNEDVLLEIYNPNYVTIYQDDVSTDQNGDFTTTYFIPAQDDYRIEGTYSVYASTQSGFANTTFIVSIPIIPGPCELNIISANPPSDTELDQSANATVDVNNTSEFDCYALTSCDFSLPSGGVETSEEGCPPIPAGSEHTFHPGWVVNETGTWNVSSCYVYNSSDQECSSLTLQDVQENVGMFDVYTPTTTSTTTTTGGEGEGEGESEGESEGEPETTTTTTKVTTTVPATTTTTVEEVTTTTEEEKEEFPAYLPYYWIVVIIIIIIAAVGISVWFKFFRVTKEVDSFKKLKEKWSQ